MVGVLQGAVMGIGASRDGNRRLQGGWSSASSVSQVEAGAYTSCGSESRQRFRRDWLVQARCRSVGDE